MKWPLLLLLSEVEGLCKTGIITMQITSLKQVEIRGRPIVHCQLFEFICMFTIWV